MVERIVGISSNLEFNLLPDGERLTQGQIDSTEAWTSECVSPFVAKGPGGGDREGCLVKPMIVVATRKLRFSDNVWSPVEVASPQRV